MKKYLPLLIMYLLTITGIFVASNIYTLIPLSNLIAASFEVPVQQVSIATSCFTIFYALGLLCFGPISDFIGRKNTLVIGLFGSAVFTISIGFANDIFLLCIFRSLQGFTLGSFAPVAFALTFDLYPPKQRSLLLALINTGFLAAGIIGQILSSLIAFQLTWIEVFFFFGGVYFILTIISYLALPSIKQPATIKSTVFRSFYLLLKNKELQKCYFITATLLFTFISFYGALEIFYQGTFEELLAIRAIGLLGAVLSLFTGKWFSKINLKMMLNFSFLAGIVSLVLMLVWPNKINLMVQSVLFVASISLLIPAVISIIGTVSGNERSKALSLYSFILLAFASLASPISLMLPFRLLITLLTVLFIINLCIAHFIKIEK
nr:MFS transporter [Neobacillus sp. Marseille-Q6967]